MINNVKPTTYKGINYMSHCTWTKNVLLEPDQNLSKTLDQFGLAKLNFNTLILIRYKAIIMTDA